MAKLKDVIKDGNGCLQIITSTNDKYTFCSYSLIQHLYLELAKHFGFDVTFDYDENNKLLKRVYITGD